MYSVCVCVRAHERHARFTVHVEIDLFFFKVLYLILKIKVCLSIEKTNTGLIGALSNNGQNLVQNIPLKSILHYFKIFTLLINKKK